MSESEHAAAGEPEQEQARRAQLLRVILIITGVVSIASIVVFSVLGYLVPGFPTLSLVLPLVFLAAGNLVSFWLLWRGHVAWAVRLYVPVQALTALAWITLVGGTAGPLAPTLVITMIMAAALLPYTTARLAALASAVAYIAIAALQAAGLATPPPLPAVVSTLSAHIVLVIALLMATILVTQMAKGLHEALATAQQRSRELAESRLRAEEAVHAEREAREREEKAARALERAVKLYSAFLARVSSGDFAARLPSLVEEDEADQPRELAALGSNVNRTVETLVHALEDLQAVQRRYVREAWAEYSTATEAPRSFHYDGTTLEPGSQAWLDVMGAAIEDRGPVTANRDLALPIALRGEVIGALGVRRTGDESWTAEDTALAQAAADQLAQTIENLRLLDETQRRAAREGWIGQAADRMQRASDVTVLLRTAAEDLTAAFGATHTLVQLGGESELVAADGAGE